MVQERAAVGRLEPVVRQGKLPGEPAGRHVGCVIVAQRQAADVRPGDEFVVLAVSDLVLVLIKGVQRAADGLIGRDIFGKIVRCIGQIGRNARVGLRGIRAGFRDGGQCCIRFAVLVQLGGNVVRVGDAVCAREVAVKRVETPILLIYDDQVIDGLLTA